MRTALTRETVEAIIRDVITERLGTHRTRTTAAPARRSPLVVNVIDTDEAHACGLHRTKAVELIVSRPARPGCDNGEHLS